MCKSKKMCAKSIMEHQYVLWNNKIHCFIIPVYNVYNVPRKRNLLPLVPYKGTYHMLLNEIHTSCITEVIGSYIFIAGNQYGLEILSCDFNGG